MSEKKWEPVHNTLTEIFFLVEFTNHLIMDYYKRHSDEIKQSKSDVGSHINTIFGKIWGILSSEKNINWNVIRTKHSMPQILLLCLDSGLNPIITKDVLYDTFSLFFESLNLGIDKINKNNVVKKHNKTAALQVNYYSLPRKIFIFDTSICSCCSFQKPEQTNNFKIVKGFLDFLDEPFDIISILQKYISQKEKLGEYAINHKIQKWVRSVFGLKYKPEIKFKIGKICKEINYIFFKDDQGSLYLKRQRSNLISLEYLIQRISEIFGDVSKSDDPPPIIKSIGIFLFLRFAKSQKVRFLWIAEKQGHADDNNHNGSKKYDSFAGISSLMPIEYNYFIAKSFGSFSSVSGLNFIFRGGLLPNTNIGKILAILGGQGTGKTLFALQRLVDVAFFGGVSIYFSFEEKYDIIIDRLNSFNLINKSRFDTKVCYFSNIQEVIDNKDTAKGLLLFYQFSPLLEQEGNFQNIINKISNCNLFNSEKQFKWKSIAIDSINALNLCVPLTDNDELRLHIGELVKIFQKQNFFAIILCEKGKEEENILPFLSDAVIELEFSDDNRLFEIKKSRNQNYHFGKHPFRITDGVGIKIYPLLDSMLSTFRHKARATFSEDKRILFSPACVDTIFFNSIVEKSITLITGKSIQGKYSLLMKLLTTPISFADLKNNNYYHSEPRVNSILIISFAKSEYSYFQTIRNLSNYYKKEYKGWEKIAYKKIRWFSPGKDLTGEQIVFELLNVIRRASRNGHSIERVVIDGFDAAENIAPRLQYNGMFWITLIEMLRVEAITTFFIESETFSSNDDRKDLFENIKYQSDYWFDIKERSDFNTNIYILSAEKWVDPYSLVPHVQPIKAFWSTYNGLEACDNDDRMEKTMEDKGQTLFNDQLLTD
ncbi:MAG: hypothetical protein KGZ62_05465 [Sulfurimonas sp.]|nr:hypothetical protein [Sulfurimonas sp.]